MNFGKRLIISPHPDDEVLGCGGIMTKYSSDVTTLYVTAHHPGVDDEIYHKECLSISNKLQTKEMWSRYLAYTNVLSTLPPTALITSFEDAINECKPDTIFVCFPSYNQDHRVVFDALITATRPHDKNWFVKNVLVYEQPETLHTNRFAAIFTPRVFVPINIEDKIDLYKLYKSQIRGHRGVDTVRAIATLRGSFIGQPAAEAFDVIRMTV